MHFHSFRTCVRTLDDTYNLFASVLPDYNLIEWMVYTAKDSYGLL